MDLNADLGEGFGRWELTDDDALLRIVTSANVACGFHAGDPVTLMRVCETAADAGVSIGAQVSYRDLAGFGRREMEVPPLELAAEVAYQIGALRVFAEAAGSAVRYVKPHGALYHRAGRDGVQARAVVEGALLAGVGVLLCQTGTELEAAAKAAGVRVIGECFADRGYLPSGRLVPRGMPGALLGHEAAVAQALDLAEHGRVSAVGGERIPVAAESICVHGDGAGAVAVAQAIRSALDKQGIKVEAFA
ncbi:LamB/YcsF family protein [Glycomyces buryatensis]|uniref:LamB/YcsF family protein n=1 Tax=Glycomyces buryatensis TaxID=2570927 RepID=A0A4S8Q0Y8_9ACTN|nr:5-oxoprolinase subunit PxpA [Glycomyces buryatensis]THV37743.1 LamB/YcsF family protein [Glycomyces buryatensis]